MAGHATAPSHASLATGPFAWYFRIPLYLKIVIGMIAGAIVGKIAGPSATPVLKPISMIVLRMLTLLATPLVFIAVIHAIVKAKGSGTAAARMLWLLMSNTTVAILIGLLIANTVRPGTHNTQSQAMHAPETKEKERLLDKLPPPNFIDPFLKNDILPLIVIAVAVGVAMRKVRANQLIAGKQSYKPMEDLLDTGFELVMAMLHWVLALVPLAVFAVVAATVGKEGLDPLKRMLWFVVSVVAALLLQASFYLFRLRLGSWVRPTKFLKGASDALFLAFSTASSAATLPVTYGCVKDKIGVREENAGLGVMVGGTFNHDGTALYEAMAALFVAQSMGMHLTLVHQVVVVLMAIVASVGAAGIPEAGTVTMIAVFRAVDLPIEFIPLLLPLDWFLDRCRTAINVMGDMSVACLLDGKHPHERVEERVSAHRSGPQLALTDAAP